MEKNLKILIENDLCIAISTFHDCNSASERNTLVKNYTINFCKTYNLDVMEVIDFLIEYFDKKRKTIPMFPYEHYKKNSLKKIILKDDDFQK